MSAARSGVFSTKALLGIEIEVCSVDLVEAPEQILCGSIHVVASCIVWKVLLKG